jgi:arabinofuranan 3-O-arabinosyltransferase
MTLCALYLFGVPLLLDPAQGTANLLGANLQDCDFINYWVAGKQVIAGDVGLLFKHDSYAAQLQSLVGVQSQTRSWSYPPHYLLLMWPLGLMEFVPALAAFLLSTMALFIASLVLAQRRFAPEAGLTWTLVGAGAFAVMACATTQNGFLTGAFMLAALSFMHTRPALSGLALALLTVKPHLGLLFAAVVLLDRNWRVLWWTAGSTVALVALSALWFGTDCWLTYLQEAIPYQRHVMIDWQGIFLRMMPSAFGSLRTLKLYPYDALLLHAVVALAALRFLIWPILKSGDALHRAVGVLAGTFVLTPYAFNYDMGALSVLAALLAQELLLKPANAMTRLLAASAALLAVLPAAMMHLGLMKWPISPLLLVTTLALLRAASRAPPHAAAASA